MNGQRKRKSGESRLALQEQALHERLAECGLTQRQQEVAELVMWGLSNREIAEQLLIEEYTVKVHLRDIFLKLNVHRRTALIAKILQLAPIQISHPSRLVFPSQLKSKPRDLVHTPALTSGDLPTKVDYDS